MNGARLLSVTQTGAFIAIIHLNSIHPDFLSRSACREMLPVAVSLLKRSSRSLDLADVSLAWMWIFVATQSYGREHLFLLVDVRRLHRSCQNRRLVSDLSLKAAPLPTLPNMQVGILALLRLSIAGPRSGRRRQGRCARTAHNAQGHIDGVEFGANEGRRLWDLQGSMVAGFGAARLLLFPKSREIDSVRNVSGSKASRRPRQANASNAARPGQCSGRRRVTISAGTDELGHLPAATPEGKVTSVVTLS